MCALISVLLDTVPWLSSRSATARNFCRTIARSFPPTYLSVYDVAAIVFLWIQTAVKSCFVNRIQENKQQLSFAKKRNARPNSNTNFYVSGSTTSSLSFPIFYYYFHCFFLNFVYSRSVVLRLLSRARRRRSCSETFRLGMRLKTVVNNQSPTVFISIVRILQINDELM